MSYRLIRHADADAMASKLAAEVAAALEEAIAARGRAGLAVPGGSTPEAFLTDLGRAPIEWERVGVTLTDERWVPVSDARSNQGMVARTLFRGPAAAAEFVPLYGGHAEIADGLPSTARALERIVLPLDVAVIGMGDDLHTASLFPNATGLEAALAGDEAVVAIRAPAAEEPRVTLSAPVLAGAGRVFLLIRGQAKLDALEAAEGRSAQEAPVMAVLGRAADAEVHWAP